MSDNDVRHSIGLPSAKNESEATSLDTLQSFVATWFSSTRATEPMMRGIANEGAVFAALLSKPFVNAIYEYGMLGKSDAQWPACSPDGVALIDATQLQFQCVEHPTSSSKLASVEIKTSVTRSSLDRALGRATVDVICCSVGDNVFIEYIPKEHVGQILQQTIVLSVNYVLYVWAAEVGILFIAVVYCDRCILDVCVDALNRRARCTVSWAHEEDCNLPTFVDRDSHHSIEK